MTVVIIIFKTVLNIPLSRFFVNFGWLTKYIWLKIRLAVIFRDNMSADIISADFPADFLLG